MDIVRIYTVYGIEGEVLRKTRGTGGLYRIYISDPERYKSI